MSLRQSAGTSVQAASSREQPRPERTREVKLTPPETPRAFVPRPEVVERLDEALSRRLTTVVAGPGFGKSTLLAEWGRSRAAAWYTVDAGDESLSTFARGVTDALRVQAPLVSVEVPAAVETAGGGDTRERADALAALVAQSIEDGLDDDLVLVLDDVQELGRSTSSARFLAVLCRQAPARLHVVLSSRREAPFPTERLRGRGQVLRLDASLLAFSVEDVGRLLEKAGLPGGEFDDELYALTRGWPATVRLAAEALAAAPQGERRRVLDRLSRPEGPLFPYLAEEVFGPRARQVREFLRRVALFDRFTPELCEELGVVRPAQTLAELLGRGLFVQALSDDGWFGLHALVREFARSSWPLPDEERRKLELGAAAWFDRQGESAEALRLLVGSEDLDALARFLEQRGQALLSAGLVQPVLRAVDRFPADARTPSLEQLAGQALQVRGDWDGALACLRRAGGTGPDLSPGIAWRIGMLHYLRGQLDDAVEVFARARLDGGEPREEALLLAWSATAQWVQGDAETSRALAQRAYEVASAVGDHQGLAAAHTILAMLASLAGDRAGIHHHDGLALEHALEAGDVLQLIRIRANQGSHLAHEGAYEAALEQLDEAIRLAELAGFANFLALSLSNRGQTRLYLGRLEEALVDFDAARSIYVRLEARALCYPLGHLGDVHRERGDLRLARAAFEQAIAAAERSRDAQGLAPALAGLARVIAPEDPAEAERTARRALETGSGFALVPALLSRGWVALVGGDRETAAETAESAQAAAAGRRDLVALAEAIELGVLAGPEPAAAAHRLEEAISIWREAENALGEARSELVLGRLTGDAGLARRAERRLHALSVRTRLPLPAGPLAALPQENEPPVRIRCLGGFRVLRDGRPVPPSDWQSKKARDVLKLLVARRGRPVTRDQLVQALWPDEGRGKTGNRLSVALSTLRSVLDPEDRFPQEHFVRADNDAVAVELSRLAVDTEGFLLAAENGLAALRGGDVERALEQLEDAEAAYSGDFLEEDLYEDWAIPLREEARGTYITVARTLGAHAREAADFGRAARYYRRILERDPYDEDAHLGLVGALSAEGGHGEARRAYRAYTARMEEIGVEPAPFPARPAAFTAP